MRNVRESEEDQMAKIEQVVKEIIQMVQADLAKTRTPKPSDEMIREMHANPAMQGIKIPRKAWVQGVRSAAIFFERERARRSGNNDTLQRLLDAIVWETDNPYDDE